MILDISAIKEITCGADMGDVSQVLPSIHLNACGGSCALKAAFDEAGY